MVYRTSQWVYKPLHDTTMEKRWPSWQCTSDLPVVGSQRRILLGFLSCLSTWQRTGKAKGSKLWMASQHENHQQELDFSASISLTCGQFTSKKWLTSRSIMIQRRPMRDCLGCFNEKILGPLFPRCFGQHQEEALSLLRFVRTNYRWNEVNHGGRMQYSYNF